MLLAETGSYEPSWPGAVMVIGVTLVCGLVVCVVAFFYFMSQTESSSGQDRVWDGIGMKDGIPKHPGGFTSHRSVTRGTRTTNGTANPMTAGEVKDFDEHMADIGRRMDGIWSANAAYFDHVFEKHK